MPERRTSQRTRVPMRLALGLGLAAATLACADEPPAPLADLAELLPFADVIAEPGTIDFGTPGAHPYLRDGWSGDESGPGPWASFVWAMDDRSSIAFHLVAPRELRLTFRCHPAGAPGRPRQTVELVMNGTPVGTVVLETAFRAYDLRVPRQATRAGTNELEFRYAFSVTEGAESSRALAVAWDELRVADAPPPPTRLRLNGEPWLVLPPQTQVDYYLPAAPDLTLALDRVTTYGAPEAFDAGVGPTAELTVAIASAAGTVERTVSPGIADGSLRWTPDLAVEPGETVRVSLIGAAHGGAALALRQPRLTSAPSGPPAACSALPPPDRPNIVIYLVDALRRDHLGVYGYDRPVSPRLDAFARSSVVFDRAVAQAPWTRPSVASLFTGLLPPQHGVETLDDGLPPEATTLAERLEAAGYDTAAFVTNVHVSGPLGFDQGFGRFELFPERPESAGGHVPSDTITRAVTGYLDGRTSERPYFAYVHASDPHAPYAPGPAWHERFAPTAPRRLSSVEVRRLGVPGAPAERRQAAVDLYDAEVAFNDDSFGALLDDLEARGDLDRTIVVFTADHGEALGEHGEWEHGASLRAGQIEVPLVIRFPDGRWAGQRVGDVVGLVDVMPTLLRSLGADVPGGLAGRSLLDLAACPELPRPAAVSSHLTLEYLDAAAVVTAEATLVRRQRYDTIERGGFELLAAAGASDGEGEAAEAAPLLHGRLATLLRVLDLDGPRFGPGRRELAPEFRARLRALGYVR